MSNSTIVTYLGKEDPGSSCGYCKSKNGFKAWGMWAYLMTNQDYQDLIDRGFRRSGHYVYKSMMRDTCCPLYTIRNRVHDFKMSSTHRRILKQVARFLNTGEKPRTKPKPSSEGDVDRSGGGGDQVSATQRSEASDTASKPAKKEPPAEAAVKPDGDSKGVKSKEEKAKYKRWQRKLQHMKTVAEREGKTFDSLLQAYNERRKKRLEKNKEKTLEELLNLVRPDAKHKLTCKLVRTNPKSEEYKATADVEHSVYVNYQVNVHGDQPSDCDRRQFERFLVESPLIESSGALPNGYGSFHYQYWLDDKLIGVSVLDYLPHCLSSVYFFYHTDYEFLSLGTYSALREIAYVRELQAVDPAVQYYYLGYYVHSCRKMRYKGQYAASDLLCPETYVWRPIEACRPLLDRTKYNRLCADVHQADEGRGCPEMCMVLWNGSVMPWDYYKRQTAGSDRRGGRRRAAARNDADAIEYASLVGATCAKRIVLLREH